MGADAARRAKQAEYERRFAERQRAAGLCIRCKHGVAVEGSSLCAKHLEAKREWARKDNARRRAAGLESRSKQCRDRKRRKGICMKCSSPAVKGLTLCERHRQDEFKRYRDYHQRHGDAIRKRQREWCRADRIRRKERGQCFKCQNPIAEGSETMCERHLLEHNAKSNEARSALKAAGICTRCGRAEVRRQGEWSCEACMSERRGQQRAYNARNRADGLCYCCRRPVVPGKKRCAECSRRHAHNARIRRERRKLDISRCLACKALTPPGRKYCSAECERLRLS